MGKNFFNGTDSQLATGSAVFAAAITASPTTYGLVASQATFYGTINTTFQTAYTTAITPVTRTKAAILAKDAAKTALKVNASLLAKIIQATPTVTAAQKEGLGLNVRATPSPAGLPGTPYKFVVTLNPDGSLYMKWKCDNTSSGIVYNVYRQIGTAEPLFIGGSGTRQFIDNGVTAGTAVITYKIQGVRTTGAGTAGEFTVKLGVSSSGGGTVSVEEKAAPKLAA